MQSVSASHRRCIVLGADKRQRPEMSCGRRCTKERQQWSGMQPQCTQEATWCKEIKTKTLNGFKARLCYELSFCIICFEWSENSASKLHFKTAGCFSGWANILSLFCFPELLLHLFKPEIRTTYSTASLKNNFISATSLHFPRQSIPWRLSAWFCELIMSQNIVSRFFLPHPETCVSWGGISSGLTAKRAGGFSGISGAADVVRSVLRAPAGCWCFIMGLPGPHSEYYFASKQQRTAATCNGSHHWRHFLKCTFSKLPRRICDVFAMWHLQRNLNILHDHCNTANSIAALIIMHIFGFVSTTLTRNPAALYI